MRSNKTFLALTLSTALVPCSLVLAEDWTDLGLLGGDAYAGLNQSSSSWESQSGSQQQRPKPPPSHGFQGFALGDSGYELFQLELGHPGGPRMQEGSDGSEDTWSSSGSSQQRRPPRPHGPSITIAGARYRLANIEFSENSSEPPQLEPGDSPQVVQSFRADLVEMAPPPGTTSSTSSDSYSSSNSDYYSTNDYYSTGNSYSSYSGTGDGTSTTQSVIGTLEGSLVAHAPPARPERPSGSTYSDTYSTSSSSLASEDSGDRRRGRPPGGQLVLEAQVSVDGIAYQLLGLQGGKSGKGPGGHKGGAGQGRGNRNRYQGQQDQAGGTGTGY